MYTIKIGKLYFWSKFVWKKKLYAAFELISHQTIEIAKFKAASDVLVVISLFIFSVIDSSVFSSF